MTKCTKHERIAEMKRENMEKKKRRSDEGVMNSIKKW